MIKLKDLLSEYIKNNPEDIFIKCYNILSQYSRKELSGGNCGQVTFAIARFVFDKFKINSEIGLVTNGKTEEQLLEEVDIYHVYNQINGQRIDETGKIDDDYLLNLVYDQYKDYNPEEYEFSFPAESSNIIRIISYNTNYNTDWNYFYTILEKKYK